MNINNIITDNNIIIVKKYCLAWECCETRAREKIEKYFFIYRRKETWRKGPRLGRERERERSERRTRVVTLGNYFSLFCIDENCYERLSIIDRGIFLFQIVSPIALSRNATMWNTPSPPRVTDPLTDKPLLRSVRSAGRFRE